jgi:hypothetical protein
MPKTITKLIHAENKLRNSLIVFFLANRLTQAFDFIEKQLRVPQVPRRAFRH